MQVLFTQVSQYKTSIYEIARGVLRSRNRQAEINRKQSREVRELQMRVEQLYDQLQCSQKLLAQAHQEIESQQRENEQLRRQPIRLPRHAGAVHFAQGRFLAGKISRWRMGLWSGGLERVRRRPVFQDRVEFQLEHRTSGI